MGKVTVPDLRRLAEQCDDQNLLTYLSHYNDDDFIAIYQDSLKMFRPVTAYSVLPATKDMKSITSNNYKELWVKFEKEPCPCKDEKKKKKSEGE